MALVLSIGIALVIGVSIMYQTQYFWGKESNDNINTINCTMNNLSNTFYSVGGLMPIVIVAIVFIGILMYTCTLRGF